MSNFTKVFFLTALLAGVCAHDANADKKTVCSITVNSPDEKEAFRRSLPPNKYQFVELVERGRSDWLESACHQGIHCIVFLSSGTYVGANGFFWVHLERVGFFQSPELKGAPSTDRGLGCSPNLREVNFLASTTI